MSSKLNHRLKLKITIVILICFNLFLHAQERIISGLVIDENNSPIPGVTIQIKGTTLGTATDVNGKYSLRLESTADIILVFSSVGYIIQELSLGTSTTLDVQLLPSTTFLEEIVITGYSTLNKKDLASSITAVDTKEMTKIAASNFAEQLQGKVAGVQIATSGDPGSFQYVRIRGIGSINNNEPLYVIDGVPIQNETNMNFLNPNDIESMQVLKDAAAASLYGARAANGVIVITTKKGTGQSKFNIDVYTGLQVPRDMPELASPTELLQIYQGLSDGAGTPFSSQFYIQDNSGNWKLPDYSVLSKGYAAGDPAVDPSKYVLNTTDPSQFGKNYPIVELNKPGTNWFNEMYRPATITSAQVSASGGNDKGNHYFSLGYFEHQGILIKNKYQRVQLRLNNTYSNGNNFRFGENLNIAFQNNKGSSTGDPGFSVRNQTYMSIVPLYDINGYWAASSQSSLPSANPVAGQTRTTDGTSSYTVRVTGNTFFEIDFLKSFTFRTNLGIDYNQGPVEVYTYTCPECGNSGSQNSLTKSWNSGQSWIGNSTINYNNQFGNHKVYALVGVEARESYYEGFNARGQGLQFGDDPNYRELGNAQSGSYSIGSYSGENRMVSAFFNVNYTYNDKYIISATVRRDGSSRFINNQYGTFPGVSAAWRISKESFFTNISFISELKLRASYGNSGNNEVVGGDYPGYSTYGTSLNLSSYDINGTKNSVVQGFAQTSSGNPNLKWETTTLTNIAFDMTLMKNLDMTVEWYNRKTKDMIYGVDQPLETGLPYKINQNIGSMVNKGIDLQLTYHKTVSKELSYSIGVTGMHYKNEVLSLNADSVSFLYTGFNESNVTKSGYPISQFYGYATDGLWESYDEINNVLFSDTDGDISGAKPGRFKFKDVNGDGKITPDDRTIIGNPIPKFIIGLNLTLNYKNFDLTTFFNGVFGNKIFNAVDPLMDFYRVDNFTDFGDNRGNKMLYEAGKSLPVLDATDNISSRFSDYWVEDGSYVRFKNLIVGYSFPTLITTKIGLTKARIYFQAQNLFTWTKYRGLDPDVTVFNMNQGNVVQRDLITGFDAGRYPWSRQFIIGVNIEF